VVELVETTPLGTVVELVETTPGGFEPGQENFSK
jgi:hypothetical protein